MSKRPTERQPLSPHSRIVVHLDEADHRRLKIEAARQDRTVVAQARYFLKIALKDVKP